MKIQNKQSGYIGILLILLGTAGALFLFMKTYFMPSETINEFQPNNTQVVPPATQYDSLISDINAAKSVSNKMNQKAVETNFLINNTK
jgi:hypothetical protein